MSRYLEGWETRECKKCRRVKPLVRDFYQIGHNGRGQMRYKHDCKACLSAANTIRAQAVRAAAAANRHHATLPRTDDPAILLYREEKRKAAPRLKRKQKEAERVMHAMVERLATATAHGFYLAPRDLTA